MQGREVGMRDPTSLLVRVVESSPNPFTGVVGIPLKID